MKKLKSYVTDNGRKPFDDWIEKLPTKIQARIDAYLRRIALGGAQKNVKRLKGQSGLMELKIDTGPGYRVYFAEVGQRIILLLAGGTKRTQKRNIEQAKKYWRSFSETL